MKDFIKHSLMLFGILYLLNSFRNSDVGCYYRREFRKELELDGDEETDEGTVIMGFHK